MNDEQKQNHPAAEHSENGGNKQGRNRRRRHRGGNKQERRDTRDLPADQNPQGSQSAVGNRAPQNNPNTAPDRQESQKSNGGRNRRRRRGKSRQQNQGIVDLYGTPKEVDSLSPEELRAMIVVQAADGSIPVAPATLPENESTDVPTENEVGADPTFIREEDLLSSPEVLQPRIIPQEDRAEVVGVRFRGASKSYYFDPKGKTIHTGDYVVADTARGSEFGEVTFGNRFVSKKSLLSPLRPILRVATPEDIARNRENREREKEAGEIFYKKMREHRLVMKLIDVQFAFDNSKLLFYFTSEGRVDFRELVKDLAGVFRTRIELRQIGIRDEARLLGGLGACGRPLCCASFLPDFAQVSIKMAKEQGLSLNSAKISGACGRLMCCLRYEAESYAEEIRRTPPVGSTVKTPDGVGEVIGSNPIAAIVRVRLEDRDAPKQYPRDDVTVIGREKSETAEKRDPR